MSVINDFAFHSIYNLILSFMSVSVAKVQK
jgi:hypothetical protein